MNSRVILTVLVLLGTQFSVSRADNIWDRRDPRYANLFQDNRARNVGDILIVTISESTTASDRESRANDKRNRSSGTVNYNGQTSGSFAAGTVTNTGALQFAQNNDMRRQFDGAAQLSSTRTFTDSMAVTVVDILPNGNLVLEGYRSRVVAGEERVLRITGVVRQADVGVGNKVASTTIANAQLSYLGRGPESRSINQNFFGRIVNRIWPW